jgi:hypothetical protein
MFECLAYAQYRRDAWAALDSDMHAAPGDNAPRAAPYGARGGPVELDAMAFVDYARMGPALHTIMAPFVYKCWRKRGAVLRGDVAALQVGTPLTLPSGGAARGAAAGEDSAA